MTREAFLEKVKNGARVQCQTPEERNCVLEFFEREGFQLAPATSAYIHGTEAQQNASFFIHPVYNANYECIVCWSYIDDTQDYILYEQIADIVEGRSFMDQRSDIEFLQDFKSLMS